MRYGPDNPKVQETLTIIRQLNANPSLPNMKNYLQHVDVLDSDAHDSLRQIFEDVSTMTEEEMDEPYFTVHTFLPRAKRTGSCN